MIVFLEANIASGKSSACEFLRKYYPVFVEPVDMWSNHLHGIYGPDAADWGLPMQMLALTTRHELLLRAIDMADATRRIVVVERSPRSDAIFAQDLVGDDMKAYQVVRDRYTSIVAGLAPRTKHIYMRADPEICMGRVAVRGRPQERTMTLERSQEIHRRHELEFASDITVDANRAKPDVFNDVLQLIKGFEHNFFWASN
jgi:deoxyadenosine/deoxycytidine kinase